MSTLTAGTYTIDAAHSDLGFSVRHAGISKVRGRFTDFSGSFTVGEPVTESSATVTIDAASVDTGNEQRDGHLVSEDFWNAAQNPQWSFSSTAVSGTADDLSVEGELTINGVRKPVTLAAEFNGSASGPEGETRASFSATTSISRKDFDLTWNVALEGGGLLVGDKIAIELEVVGILNG